MRVKVIGLASCAVKFAAHIAIVIIMSAVFLDMLTDL